MGAVTDAPVYERPLNFLIIHGWWQDSWWWQPAAAYLEHRGHRVWTPNLPGCAPGDRDAATVTLQDMVKAVVELVEATAAMRSLVVVAHAGGGPIAQLVAAVVPERISTLVFVNAWALAGGEGDECIADLLPVSLKPVIQRARRGEPVPMHPGVWLDSFAQDATVAGRTEGGPRVAATLCPADWLTAMPDWRPFWDLLGGGSFATYYVFLDADKAVPAELYWQMATRLQPATTVVAPGSHQGFHAHFREFVHALLELLR
jgi:pimeloyl-ACP methyl ester carboxylesterase